MRLIRGDQLPPDLRTEVLRAFIHRWTVENARQTYGGRCPACMQAIRPRYTQAQLRKYHAYHSPLVSDAEWLAAHAFRVTSDGRLSRRHCYAEPAFLAPENPCAS